MSDGMGASLSARRLAPCGEETGAEGAREPRPIAAVCGAVTTEATAELAQEVPVAFEYNGIAHAVMLATRPISTTSRSASR